MDKTIDVYALGNALVDIEFEVNSDQLRQLNIEKGVMTLIDSEQANILQQHLEADQSLVKTHRRSSGGSAANSLIAIAHLGGKTHFSCRVADDDLGHFYLQDLTTAGVAHAVTPKQVNPVMQQAEQQQTGRCLVFVTPDADRTMNTYLGISSQLATADIATSALAAARYLYLEGYLVSEADSLAAMQAAIRMAKENNTKIALTLSDPNIVKFFHAQIMALVEQGVDMIFANADEACAYAGFDPGQSEAVTRAAKQLGAICPYVVITQGADPTLVVKDQQIQSFPVQTVEPVDTLGAGDIFAGAYLYALTQDYTDTQANQLASSLAAKLITRFGPRLDRQTLLAVFQQHCQSN